MLSRDLQIAVIREAASFSEMLAVIARDPEIGLVTINLGLPGLRGGEGLRRLRMDHPSLLVVVVASTRDREPVLDALCAGVHGYIPNDLPTDEMLEAFRTVFSGHIYVPSLVSDVSATRPLAETPRAAHENGLTERQHQVLQLLAFGKSNKEIARMLRIAEGTVKVHITAAFRLLGVHNRVSAAAALQNWPMAAEFIPGMHVAHDRRIGDAVGMNGAHPVRVN